MGNRKQNDNRPTNKNRTGGYLQVKESTKGKISAKLA